MSGEDQEVELRLQVSDTEALQCALSAAGAQLIGRGLVRTTAYDFPDKRLRAARQTLRLREDWTGTELTAKIPHSSEEAEDAGQAKVREEINIPLQTESAPNARRLLESIGLRESLHYAKERVSWHLDSARIDVDTLVDGGACFVEIEADPAVITAVRAKIGLDAAAVETRSYFEIVHLARSTT